MIEPIVAGYISVGLLILFLFMALPVGLAMGLSGVTGILLATGMGGLFMNIGTIGFEKVFSISLLAIPLFVFMGNIVTAHRLGADLYDATYKWTNKISGGLCITSLFVGALFGFMCGSASAGAATIGGVALPEMINRGYDKKLATGCLAFGGTLSSIIPPSGLMIIYASQVEASIGKLFFAGIVPGLILTVMASIYIFGYVAVHPNAAPKGVETYPLGEKMRSLTGILPVVILFLTVLGGMYAGIFSPVEAGATGSLVAYFICLAYRRFSRASIKAAILHTVSTSVMIYVLIIGASLLSQMFFVSGLRQVITKMIVGWDLAPWLVIVVFLFVLMILGMFMDVIGMLLVSLPIMFPVVVQLGYDPIWFGILIILSCEMALITPPVGVNLFILQAMAPKGTSLFDVGKGAAGFVLVVWLLFLLLLWAPNLVLWLPATMLGR